MEEPEEKRIRIELPLEVDNHEKSHEKRCEENYEDSVHSSVSLHYDILRIVFRYLNGRDLSSVAMVCRSWLEAANNEKSLRRRPHCFIEQYMPVDICASRRKRNILLNIVDASQSSVTLASLQSLMMYKSLDRIKESPIKPSIGFFFLPLKTPHDSKRRICELLPKNCEAIMLFTDGIILNNDEMEHPFPNIVCALLPEIPNVKISMVVVTDPEENEYTEYIQMIEGVPRRDHKTSTCLMLFCNRYGHKIGSDMASIAKLRHSNDKSIVSFWGGAVEKMQTNNDRFFYPLTDKKDNVAEPYCVAILITGLIQTWSIVVDSKCNTKEQVEKKLKLFKEQVKLQKYSVGFMFACKARGTNMYHEKNVESTIFKRIFPEVPLVGCFGNGEFGSNTTVYKQDHSLRHKLDIQHKMIEKNIMLTSLLAKPPGYCPPKSPKSQSPWYNEFSTIFMILTYG